MWKETVGPAWGASAGHQYLSRVCTNLRSAEAVEKEGLLGNLETEKRLVKKQLDRAVTFETHGTGAQGRLPPPSSTPSNACSKSE